MTDRAQRDFDDLLTDRSSRAAVAVDADDGTPRGSRVDDLFARVVSTPVRRRIWDLGLPLAVVLVAAFLRLWNLGHPRSLVFDETFYVKDAWTLWNLGFEGAWPENPDPAFAAGDTSIYTGEASFVVHPPLGKWIIGLGMGLFGSENPAAWRIGTAVCGILTVLLVIVVAKLLFRSTLIASFAGLMLAIDGHAIVLSRVALLDGVLTTVSLAGVTAVLLDRRWATRRLAQRIAAGTVPGPWGPVLWWRPWLVTAGVLFGAAAGVKWTGVYFLAVYGVYVVLADALLRRSAGISFWASAAVLRQGPVSFLLMVPVALAAYLATWSGWLLTSGGWARQWTAEAASNAWTGALAWVPDWAQNLWHYHAQMYQYSINLRATHPYEANPLTWLLMRRPTSMYFVDQPLGVDGCTMDRCAEAITSIANPLIWYAGVAALLYLLYRLVRFADRRAGFVLVGIVAGYLPWMLYLDRTVFQFYCVVFEPYLVLALALTASIAIGSRRDPRARRSRALAVLGVFTLVAIGLTIFFYPIWTGQQTSFAFWQSHMWLPTWV